MQKAGVNIPPAGPASRSHDAWGEGRSQLLQGIKALIGVTTVWLLGLKFEVSKGLDRKLFKKMIMLSFFAFTLSKRVASR